LTLDWAVFTYGCNCWMDDLFNMEFFAYMWWFSIPTIMSHPGNGE